jgi:hypothetical protein
VQAVEIGATVDAEQHGLAVDHEASVPASKRGLGDERKSVAPIVTVAREQPNALAVALNYQAVAVMFDFVNPLRSVAKVTMCCLPSVWYSGHAT